MERTRLKIRTKGAGSLDKSGLPGMGCREGAKISSQGRYDHFDTPPGRGTGISAIPVSGNSIKYNESTGKSQDKEFAFFFYAFLFLQLASEVIRLVS